MKLFYTDRFKKSFSDFSKEIQRKFEKQIIFLLDDFRHPSLQVKKYDTTRAIWQARVDRAIRFYFLIKEDFYVLLDITDHPK
jgi:mRNA-degrading endonuclease RelE of RelBE toxin-antitoxin system